MLYTSDSLFRVYGLNLSTSHFTPHLKEEEIIISCRKRRKALVRSWADEFVLLSRWSVSMRLTPIWFYKASVTGVCAFHSSWLIWFVIHSFTHSMLSLCLFSVVSETFVWWQESYIILDTILDWPQFIPTSTSDHFFWRAALLACFKAEIMYQQTVMITNSAIKIVTILFYVLNDCLT